MVCHSFSFFLPWTSSLESPTLGSCLILMNVGLLLLDLQPFLCLLVLGDGMGIESIVLKTKQLKTSSYACNS